MKNKNSFNFEFPFDSEKVDILKTIEKNCSDIQCAWLSGYFWNLSNKKSTLLQKKNNLFDLQENSKKSITIISASQTGNAKLLSERLSKYLNINDKKTVLKNASDYNFKKINHERFLILIVSTHGEGEPPEEALSLYRFVMSKKSLKLNNLYYSVFGLGDVSYNLFCQAAKDFDKRLEALGAKRLLKRIDADIEYEKKYLIWSKELLISLNKNQKNLSTSINFSQTNAQEKSNIYTKNNPVLAILSVNQKITGRNSIKDIRHIELDIKEKNFCYEPGDAIGVWYQNSDELIERLLKSLSIKMDNKITFNHSLITIFDVLKKSFDITTNTKDIVKKYSNITKNKFLEKIILDANKLKNYVKNIPLVQMIYDFPKDLSCEELLSILRPLTPRLYSIASSQSEIFHEVHITVGIVKKFIDNFLYLGGASGYLSHYLKIDDSLEIFVEKNNNFRLPKDKSASIIMIGSGTGIAPFRAFMQHRDNDGSTGKNWIFFGNPNFTEDFLYQIEWQRYLKNGVLNKMSLAWSRDQKNKIYVQDKMKENSREIWEWIQSGAYLYICGDASYMAKDVENTLLNIFQKNGNMDLEKSNEFLDYLRINKRYQRDVY